MSNPEENPVKKGYAMCFEKCYNRKETIEYMKEMHNETEERARKVFNGMLMGTLKGTDYLTQADKASSERKKQKEIVTKGYEKCIEEYYTKKETIDYMNKMYKETEASAGLIFETMMNKKGGTDYLEEAEKHAKVRDKRRSKRDKNKLKAEVINDRLKILPPKTFELVQCLSLNEREILGFFVTKDFSKETSHISEGRHEASFDCHCFSCYHKKNMILSSCPNRALMERIMEEYTLKEDSVA